MDDWFWVGAAAALTTVLKVLGIYAATILATRVSGLRSFAKMSSFDFATTVAVSTVIASTALSASVPLLKGVVALVTLFAAQRVVSAYRLRAGASPLVDNQPLLLMKDAQVLHDNLTRAGVTKADLFAKLRGAGVLSLDEVRAVVLETTGDMSVLAGDDTLDDDLLFDVSES